MCRCENPGENEVWIYFRSPERTQHLKLALSVNSELTTLHVRAVGPQWLCGHWQLKPTVNRSLLGVNIPYHKRKMNAATDKVSLTQQ